MIIRKLPMRAPDLAPADRNDLRELEYLWPDA